MQHSRFVMGHTVDIEVEAPNNNMVTGSIAMPYMTPKRVKNDPDASCIGIMKKLCSPLIIDNEACTSSSGCNDNTDSVVLSTSTRMTVATMSKRQMYCTYVLAWISRTIAIDDSDGADS